MNRDRTMHKRRHIQRAHLSIALAVFLGATLAGCSSEEHRDLQEHVAEVKRRPPGRVAPLPEFEVYETFTYEAHEDRDPFRPREEAILTESNQPATSGPKPPEDRNPEALERFPLDGLAFVGLLQKGDTVWGIIKDPEGLVHRVQAGNHVGQNYGEITSISESKIELKEIVPDGRGGFFKREAAIAIEE